jgi:hypothetical protein
MRRQGSFRRAARRQLDDAIQAGRSLAGRHGGALPASEQLLSQIRSRTALLSPSGRTGDHRTRLNAGLLALALHQAEWLRPVETWSPHGQNAWPQFLSHAHHLLARGWTRQELGTSEGQLKDYQARLSKAFEHWAYLDELTALRDQLKAGLSGGTKE